MNFINDRTKVGEILKKHKTHIPKFKTFIPNFAIMRFLFQYLFRYHLAVFCGTRIVPFAKKAVKCPG